MDEKDVQGFMEIVSNSSAAMIEEHLATEQDELAEYIVNQCEFAELVGQHKMCMSLIALLQKKDVDLMREIQRMEVKEM